jgi:hypothetical protein
MKKKCKIKEYLKGKKDKRINKHMVINSDKETKKNKVHERQNP